MPTRDPVLQEFLASLADAFSATVLDREARAALDRIDGALQTPGPAGPGAGRRLPVCRHLDAALTRARAETPALARVADAIAVLEPSLAWMPRQSGGPFASDNWPDGHANATVVGPNGLEARTDLAIGISLLAPQVRYPDHRHSPEEVYLVLSPGRFHHDGSGWFVPGPGGTLYNRPNVVHAMASDDAPLLALWCLWGPWAA